MKVLFVTSFFAIIAISAFQVIAEDENISDKIKSKLSDSLDSIKDSAGEFKQSFDGLLEQAGKVFSEKTEDLQEKLEQSMSSFRHKRSPQTYTESTQSPTDKAVQGVQNAFDNLKTNVNEAISSFSNSSLYENLKGHVKKFQESLIEVQDNLRSQFHNMTASKESDEH